MEIVILESPYAGDVVKHVAYARACVADALRRGEAPMASHLLYTQPGVLRDEVPEERALGIAAGLAWRKAASKAVIYTDCGISRGMSAAIEMHQADGRPIEYRTIKGWVGSVDAFPVIEDQASHEAAGGVAGTSSRTEGA